MKYNDPFDQMNRLFDQTRRMMWLDLEPSIVVPRRPAVESATKPFNLDVEETDEGYVVRADVPAFEPDDLNIRFEDGVLTIDAEHELTEDGETGWHQRSRRVVERLTLIEPVIEDEMRASFHNGVLEIYLPTRTVHDEDDDHVDIDIDIE